MNIYHIEIVFSQSTGELREALLKEMAEMYTDISKTATRSVKVAQKKPLESNFKTHFECKPTMVQGGKESWITRVKNTKALSA